MNLFTILSSQDFNKEAKLIALDLIYAANGVRFRPDKIELGSVMELDQRPDIDWDENTYIDVSVDIDEDLRFQGNNGLMYRRIPLDEIHNSCCLELSFPEQSFKVSDLLEQINYQLSTQLTLDDLVDDEFQGYGEVRIRANPKSLNWIGSFKANVSLDQGLRLLTKTDLDGFKLYNESEDPEELTPYKGLSSHRLTNLINKENSTDYNYQLDFSLSDIVTLEAHPQYNTSVVFKPSDPSRPEQVIRYNRLSLNDLTLLEPLEGRIREVNVPLLPFSTHEILDEINEALGLNLSKEEVVDEIYTERLTHYRLKIASDSASLAWVQSYYDFKVKHAVDYSIMRVTTDGSFRITADSQLRRTAVFED